MGIDAEMFVRTKQLKVSPQDVKHKSVRMQLAFGPENFCIQRPGKWDAGGQMALEIVDKWEQDGPDIIPAPSETFIKCHLMTRYYGPGYERGDIVMILAIARWLQEEFDPCEVWYGGDSSGVCAEPLDWKKLWDHFRSEAGRAYFGNRNSPFGARGWTGAGGTVQCDFCGIEANSNASLGTKGTGHYCPSCGQHWIRSTEGKIEKCEAGYGVFSR